MKDEPVKAASLAVLNAGVIALSACGNSSYPQVKQNTGIGHATERPTASTWKVERLASESAPAAQPPAATVKMWSNGRLAGTSSCNGVGGAAIWHPDGSFTNLDQPMISTLQACDDTPASRAFAEEFWRKMLTAKHWGSSGISMEIKFSDGSKAILSKMDGAALQK